MPLGSAVTHFKSFSLPELGQYCSLTSQAMDPKRLPSNWPDTMSELEKGELVLPPLKEPPRSKGRESRMSMCPNVSRRDKYLFVINAKTSPRSSSFLLLLASSGTMASLLPVLKYLHRSLQLRFMHLACLPTRSIMVWVSRLMLKSNLLTVHLSSADLARCQRKILPL